MLWGILPAYRIKPQFISYPDVQSGDHPRASPPQSALRIKAVLHPTHHYHLFIICQLAKKDQPLHWNTAQTQSWFNLRDIVTTRHASNLPYCKLTAQEQRVFSQAQLPRLRPSVPCSHFHGGRRRDAAVRCLPTSDPGSAAGHAGNSNSPGGVGIPLNLLEDFHSSTFLQCHSSPPAPASPIP